MIGFFQRGLLSVYAIANASGLLESGFGKWIFHRSYFAYKRWLEPTPLALKSYVKPGTWVVDVGANIGFYTLLLSRWVSANGRVVSIEPEAGNFAELQNTIATKGIDAKVVAFQAVASDIDGYLRLRLNPESHADHRIADEGVKTRSVRLDSFLQQWGNPRVSLIKIDVQGAELRVLLGSVRILSEFAPAVYMEVDDRALLESNSSAAELIGWMQDRGYVAYAVKGEHLSAALSLEEIFIILRKLGYADFLFLPLSTSQANAAAAN